MFRRLLLPTLLILAIIFLLYQFLLTNSGLKAADVADTIDVVATSKAEEDGKLLVSSATEALSAWD